MRKIRIRFVMKVTESGFELTSGEWPSRAGQLWDGVTVGPDGRRTATQAAGGPDGPTFYGPTFYGPPIKRED